VSNHAKKAGRQNVLRTLGNGSLKDTVSGVFGIRQLNTLQPLQADDDGAGIALEGYISKLGCGRSSGDRQLFSINSRPVDMRSLAKVCNEVWRQFTSHQYPVVIINVTMKRGDCDINVNPDKRQMLLHTESELKELLREALTKAYAPPALSQGTTSQTPSASSWLVSPDRSSSSGAVSPPLTAPSPAVREADAMQPGAAAARPDSLGAHDRDSGGRNESEPAQKTAAATGGARAEADESLDGSGETAAVTQTAQDGGSAAAPDQPAAASPTASASAFPTQPAPSAALTRPVAAADGSAPHSVHSLAAFSADSSSQWVGARQANDRPPAAARSTSRKRSAAAAPAPQSGITAFFQRRKTSPAAAPSRPQTDGDDGDDAAEGNGQLQETVEPGRDSGGDVAAGTAGRRTSAAAASPLASAPVGDGGAPSQQPRSDPAAAAAGVDPAPPSQEPAQAAAAAASLPAAAAGDRDVTVRLELATVLDSAAATRPAKRAADDGQQGGGKRFLHANLAQEIRARRSSASAAADDKATHELARSLAKEDFEQMKVLGQFNRGFIIAQLRDDLFIIDQHACDEKYQFETLQASTKLHTQRMVNSLVLEVNVAGELVVLDNLEIMAANGFEIEVDESAPAGRRLRLKTVPLSKSLTFGPEDVYELIALLTSRPGAMVRPTRLRGMFASRACRKAVMIGTALDKPQMRQLLKNMGGLEQPWNCKSCVGLLFSQDGSDIGVDRPPREADHAPPDQSTVLRRRRRRGGRGCGRCVMTRLLVRVHALKRAIALRVRATFWPATFFLLQAEEAEYFSHNACTET